MPIAFWILLSVFLAGFVWLTLLDALNGRALRKHGRTALRGCESAFAPETLVRMQAYGAAKLRFNLRARAWMQAGVLAFVFGGGVRLLEAWIAGRTGSPMTAGVGFALVVALTLRLFEVPLSLGLHFSLEKRFGFSRLTPGLWLRDWTLATGLFLILTAGLSAAGLWLVAIDPGHWWLWLWALLQGTAVMLTLASPVVLEPLFNRFTPLGDNVLTARIHALLEKAGLKVKYVSVMDASRRTRHSNAYFSGFGASRRIVLYDTLLKTLSPEEILAVLAHEAGHWKRRHVAVRLAWSALLTLGACAAAFALIQDHAAARWFAWDAAPLHGEAFLTLCALSWASLWFSPWLNGLSRMQEREADRFAQRLLGEGRSLASALVKLGRDNLAQLCPHPWYVAFHYAHPPLAERIMDLQGRGLSKALK